jgi:murein DD-endopeptidase
VLARMVTPANAPMADASGTRLEPGFRVVAFMWLPLAKGATPPKTLRHRLVFEILDSASMRRDHGNQSQLDRVMVAVDADAVPVLFAPLRGGQWVAGSGPSNTSDHRRSLAAVDGRARVSQRFAIDWNMVGPNGDLRHGDEHLNESYWGFGQPVYAVADGQVTAVVDSLADHPARSLLPPITPANIAGNFVTIRIGPHRYATYGHLKHGSTRVRSGQHVAAGDVIALLGNTGQASAPHLHFQVTDAPGVLTAEGIPYLLRSYTDLGPGQTFEENRHPTVARRSALPGDNDVVELPTRAAQEHARPCRDSR